MTDTIQYHRWNDCRGRLTLLISLVVVTSTAGCFSVSEEKWNERDALKNRSIALLEGGSTGNEADGKNLAEATAGFSKIAKELPEERLGVQNLCVSLLLQLENPRLSDTPALFESTRKQFEQAIQSLKKRSPDGSVADILMSRYQKKVQNDRDLAIESMRAVCRSKGAGADSHFELYELLEIDSGRKPESLSEMKSALKSAAKIAPSNLVLGVTLLNTMAKTKDSGFIVEAERFRDMLQPLISRTNSSFLVLLSDGVTAAEKGEWNVAELKAMRLRNSLLGELALYFRPSSIGSASS